VRSTPQTIRTWDLTYRLCARSPRYDDQTIFWLILRTNVNPSPRPLAKCPSPDVYYAAKNLKPDSAQDSIRQLALPQMSNIVTTCPLDDCMFSAGNIRDFTEQSRLIHILHSRKDFPIMVHANWLSGKENKKSAMLRAGLWIARRAGQVQSSGAFANKSKQKAVGSGNWSCMPLSGSFRDFK
jgi:hypothetical protein